MKRGTTIVVALVILAFIVLPSWLFTIDETEQVIITQFGRYVRTVKEPGLHAKVPFVQTVHRFEKRILVSDAPSAEYLTLDKKRLVVDYISRWKIDDPLAFFKSVRTVTSAGSRINDIVFSEMRNELASHDFHMIISEKRENIMDTVASSAREKTMDFGIKLIDVRIKRADLPKEVQQSVFARMMAERERIAKRYRSEGAEESAKIRAETDKQKEIMLAEAYAKSQKLRGEGDAKATSIYASAYERDVNFYDFIRTLEAYDKVLTEDTLLVISAESIFFKYLQNPFSEDLGVEANRGKLLGR